MSPERAQAAKTVSRRSNAPTVELSPLASEQIAWLRELWQISFVQRACEILAQDPSVHRTRRIRKWREGGFLMGCGAWRIVFDVEGSTVRILRVTKGYPDRLLHESGRDRVPDRDAQIAFAERWPDT